MICRFDDVEHEILLGNSDELYSLRIGIDDRGPASSRSSLDHDSNNFGFVCGDQTRVWATLGTLNDKKIGSSVQHNLHPIIAAERA
ncbi:hypothetical protein WN72_44720 [Bradyrhizobium arachidis]|uniref:Uncharacterized protein n=1 Tax=Bradyrhizobium arachidis TaxID=858423 RepID=A0AAE7NYL6_9BRAD|nr:hypothetical protein WN72_44720 [Bradyrhizobium arachidis]